MQVAASKSLRNDFAEQMFTLQLSNILPRAILKKKHCLPLIAKRMMRWYAETSLEIVKNQAAVRRCS